MRVKYDLYKSPPRKTGEKEVTRLHARVADVHTVSMTDLSGTIQRSTTLTRTDLKAVMSEIGERFLEELQKGNRVHLEGVGYFQMTLTCPPDIRHRDEARAEAIRFKSVSYKPEKDLRKQLKGTKFVRSDRSGHTLNCSEGELAGILTGYFGNHDYITRHELENLCCMTRSTAYRRIKGWIKENKMKKITGIDAYSPVPGNFGVSREKE